MANRLSTEAVLDTSAWIAVFNSEPESASLPSAQGTRATVVTPLVLAEMVANAARGKVRHENAIAEVEAVSRLEPLTRDDAVFGGTLLARLRRQGKSKVGLGDCLIYATARRIGAVLITKDPDLAGEPDVVVLR